MRHNAAPEDYQLHQNRLTGNWKITLNGFDFRSKEESDTGFTGQQYLDAYRNRGVHPEVGLGESLSGLNNQLMRSYSDQLDPRMVVMPSKPQQSGVPDFAYMPRVATMVFSASESRRYLQEISQRPGAAGEYERGLTSRVVGKEFSEISAGENTTFEFLHEFTHATRFGNAENMPELVGRHKSSIASSQRELAEQMPGLPQDLIRRAGYTMSPEEQAANVGAMQLMRLNQSKQLKSHLKQRESEVWGGFQPNQAFELNPLSRSMDRAAFGEMSGDDASGIMKKVSDHLKSIVGHFKDMADVLPKVNEQTDTFTKALQEAGGFSGGGTMAAHPLVARMGGGYDSGGNFSFPGGGGGGGGLSGRIRNMFGGGGGGEEGGGFDMGRVGERLIRGQGLFHARLAFRMYAGEAMGMEEQYQGAQAQQAQALLSSGQIGYSQMMQGGAGTLLRRQAGMERFQMGVGEQTYQAYGGLMNAVAGGLGGAGQGILGAVAGIGLPALGAGVAATSLTGSPMVGMGVAGVTAAAGLAGYVGSNMGNDLAIGQLANSAWGAARQGGIGAGIGRFLSDIPSNFAGFTGAAGRAISANMQWLMGDQDAINRMNEQTRGSAQFATITGQAATGAMSMGSAAQQLGGLGFNRGQVMTSVLGQYVQGAQGRGITQDIALQNYQQYSMYNQGMVPTGRMEQTLTTANLLGYNPNEVIGGYASSMGVSQFDQFRMAGMQGSIPDWLNRQANPTMAYQQFGSLTGQTVGVNAQLRGAGLGQYGLDAIQMMTGGAGSNLASSPDALSASIQNLQNMAGARQNNQAMFDAGGLGAGFFRNAGLFAANGDALTANRWASQYGQMSGAFNNLTLAGMDETQAALGLGTIAGSTASQFNRATGIMGGNRAVLGQMASQGQLSQSQMWMNTMDANTGLSAYETGISGGEAQHVMSSRAAGYGLFAGQSMGGLMSSGGIGGLQNQLRLESERFQDFQMQRQATMTNAGAEARFGTANLAGASVSADGTVVTISPKSFDNFRKMFADLGLGQFNAGNGMSLNEVDVAQRKLSRQQQDYQLSQQGQQLALGDEQFALEGRQFNERWQFGMQKFQWQTNYQRQEMNIGRQRQQTQFQWQEADQAYARNTNEMQFGWQMEDFDRNIRYARGRERKDLMRQQERAVISHSMQEGQMDTQEGRLKEQEKWAEQDFTRKKRYFEEGVRFQLQEMQMQRRQFEERRQLEERQRQMTRQSYEMQMKWTQQQRALEDQAHILQTQQQMMEIANQQQMNAATLTHTQTARNLSNTISGLNMVLSDDNARFQSLRASALLLDLALQNLNKTMAGGTSSAGSYLPPQPGPGGGPYWQGGLVSYAPGGYTGSGGKFEARGIVHAGEYVIPQEGAPVIRGGNMEAKYDEMIKLLRQIAENSVANINASIYTNAKDMKVSSLNAVDKAYARPRKN
jgi:hypothetical protein